MLQPLHTPTLQLATEKSTLLAVTTGPTGGAASSQRMGGLHCALITPCKGTGCITGPAYGWPLAAPLPAQQIGFDTPTTHAKKMCYARGRGIGGIMVRLAQQAPPRLLIPAWFGLGIYPLARQNARHHAAWPLGRAVGPPTGEVTFKSETPAARAPYLNCVQLRRQAGGDLSLYLSILHTPLTLPPGAASKPAALRCGTRTLTTNWSC